MIGMTLVWDLGASTSSLADDLPHPPDVHRRVGDDQGVAGRIGDDRGACQRGICHGDDVGDVHVLKDEDLRDEIVRVGIESSPVRTVSGAFAASLVGRILMALPTVTVV